MGGSPLGSKRAQGCPLGAEVCGALLKMPSRSTTWWTSVQQLASSTPLYIPAEVSQNVWSFLASWWCDFTLRLKWTYLNLTFTTSSHFLNVNQFSPTVKQFKRQLCLWGLWQHDIIWLARHTDTWMVATSFIFFINIFQQWAGYNPGSSSQFDFHLIW
jgi:hypothetical protein